MFSIAEEMRFKFSKLWFRKKNAYNKNKLHLTPTDEDEKFGFLKSSSNSKDIQYSFKTKTSPAGLYFESKRDEQNFATSKTDTFKSHSKTGSENLIGPIPSCSRPPRDPPAFSSTPLQDPTPLFYKKPPNIKTRVHANGNKNKEVNALEKPRPPQLNRHNSMTSLGSWVNLQKTSKLNQKPTSSSRSLSSGPHVFPTNKKNHQTFRSSVLAANDNPSNIFTVPTIARDSETRFVSPTSTQEVSVRESNHHQTSTLRNSHPLLSSELQQGFKRSTSKINIQQVDKLAIHQDRNFSSVQQLHERNGLRNSLMTSSYVHIPAGVPEKNITSSQEGSQPNMNYTKGPQPSYRYLKSDGDVFEDFELQTVLCQLDQLVESSYSNLGEQKLLEDQKSRLALAQRKLLFRPFNDINKQHCESQLIAVKAKHLTVLQKLKESLKQSDGLQKQLMKMKENRFDRLNKKIASKKLRFQLEWELGRIQVGLEKLQNLDTELNLTFPEKNENKNVFLGKRTTASSLPRATSSDWNGEARFGGGPRRLRNNVAERKPLFAEEGKKPDYLTGSPFLGFSSLQPHYINGFKSASKTLRSGSYSNILSNDYKEKSFQRNTDRRRTLNGLISLSSSHLENKKSTTHMHFGIELKMTPFSPKRYPFQGCLKRQNQLEKEMDPPAYPGQLHGQFV